jgi:ubiquinone/menaquinone biosynthesis C-methylase UbiE
VTASSFIRSILKRKHDVRRLEPPDAYDCWSDTYDSQPDNAVLALESRAFTKLLSHIPLNGKTIIDIGCGTGRHWPEILSYGPEKLIGVDPSAGMLQNLKRRFPDAQVLNRAGDHLPDFSADACDVVISTLALAHIPNPQPALAEWNRILRSSGSMLITDFHSDAIRAGMKRSFVFEDVTVEIDHCSTDIPRLIEIAEGFGLSLVECAEMTIDESVRPLFERDGALDAYERHKGLHLVFGLQFSKL